MALLFDFFGVLRFDALGVKLSQFFQLASEPVSEWAFGPQLIQQILRIVKCVGREVAVLEQAIPTPGNFILSQQGASPK
jgi:hypothetical protein